MAGKKGIAAARLLALRAEREQSRGGNEAKPDGFTRSAPDALAAWTDGYLESLAVRNYSPETIEGRRDALKTFNAWAHERTLTRAGDPTSNTQSSWPDGAGSVPRPATIAVRHNEGKPIGS